MRRAVFLLLACVLAGCAGGRLKVGPSKGGEVVEAEGWSPLDSNDILSSKNRALAEAHKKAVEKVVGVYISAKTRVSKAVVLHQNILANVEGYIKKYEILSEKQEGGFYKTNIRALVHYQQIGKDLDKLGLIRPNAPPGNPRLMVLIDSPDAEGLVSAAVRKALLQRGFTVIDPNEDADYMMRKKTDRQSALSLGKAAAVDVVIRGSADSHRLQVDNIHLGGFESYRARVSLEVLKPNTGEVLGSQVKEASALDPSPKIAQSKALESAGLMAGEALARELHTSLSKRVTVEVRVGGLHDLAAVQRLVEDLRTQPDIALVSLGEYEAPFASLQVATEGFAGDELAALLMQLKSYRFQVLRVSPYLIEVRIGGED